ncbi:hypothetical protein Dimus_025030, partial [Dionaea muscipula]
CLSEDDGEWVRGVGVFQVHRCFQLGWGFVFLSDLVILSVRESSEDAHYKLGFSEGDKDVRRCALLLARGASILLVSFFLVAWSEVGSPIALVVASVGVLTFCIFISCHGRWFWLDPEGFGISQALHELQ